MKYKVGQLIIYKKGDKFEIGKIKTLRDNSASVYYHSGETAAMTSYDDIYAIENDNCITETILGGGLYE